jgi:ADP-ribose pyrophosphatase
MPQREPVPWKTISTRWLLDHPYLSAVEDEIELPNGARAQWVRFPDEREGRPREVVAAAICQRDDGRILVARQWNPGPQQVVEEFPGGGGNPGETPEEAVRRELQEEVGLYPNRLEHLGMLLHNVRKHGTPFHIFLGTDLVERELPGDDNEFIAWDWLTPAEIDAGIAEGRFVNEVLLAAWAFYRARYPARG